MGPRASEWLPDLQKALLPTAVRTVRELAHDYDPRILRDERPRLFARKILHQRYDVGTWRSPYPEAITRYTLRYADLDPDILDEREREKYDALKTELTTVGTGRDALNSGLDMVEETIIPLLQQARPQPTVVLVLDGPAWTSVADERTAARALETIALFSEVCELRLVCSPRLRQHLDRHHPEWCAEHLDLTRSRDGWGQTVPGETSERTRNEAWATITQFDPDGGRLTILEALSSDSDRTVRELKADPELALADGTIDRYVRELADEHGFIGIDSRPTSNHLTLTETGTAATALLGPDGRPHHPEQSRFASDRTRTYHDSTSVVCRADRDEESPTPADDSTAADRTGDTAPSTTHSSSASAVPASAPTAEEWLADTGRADENGYVQWLDGPDNRLDAWTMHERLRAGQRCAGVTVVDDPTQPFDDGKVSYISCFDDHAQVVVQWGGALPTLVRITNALLSERMFETVLTPATVGDDLDALYNGTLDSSIDDILRLGAQVGWFSDDEHDYGGLRERYSAVRRRLLAQLSTLDRDDTDSWSELCRDAHGLLASATQLYHASDIDLTIHIRVPDTATLQAGTQRYREFCDFFKYTVPKNAAYGVHSVHRLLYEQRVDKLKHRLGYAFDDDPTAELTASWVVSGPTASTFREDIESAIATNASDVRDAIQEGTRRGVGFEIPVVEGNSYAALRQVLDRQADRKGFTLDSTDRRGIIRLATATLGTEPGRCSPYAFAEALLAIARPRTPSPTLSPTDVAYGLTQLPAERLVPSLPPTMQKVLKTLLVADDPLGRSTIAARSGISTASYDRNIDELAALEMVEATGNGGHRKWQAWAIPWWSPISESDTPRTAESDDNAVARPTRWDDTIYRIVCALDCDHDDELFIQPIDVDEVFATLPRLDRWRGFIEAHYGRGAASPIAETDSDSNSDRQSADGSVDTTHTVEIGAPPETDSSDGTQLTLKGGACK